MASKAPAAILVAAMFAAGGCPSSNEGDGSNNGAGRLDDAIQVLVDATGSLQNPAWSPGGTELLCTQFKGGYNVEPADLLIVAVEPGSFRQLVGDGSGNINLPGSSWNATTGQITFASTREPHDEIYVIDANGVPGDEERVTFRDGLVAYEPSFSPEGQWVVFESHMLDVEGNGIVMKYEIDGSGDYVALTAQDDDCRQPNWAPAGGHILYQRLANGQWDLWVMNTDGIGAHQVTTGTGDKTDASFSPDGEQIVYSSDEGGLDSANLFVIPTLGGAATRITRQTGYDGAPSWSPDGSRIAFESSPTDPDDSPGTTLWLIDAPR